MNHANSDQGFMEQYEVTGGETHKLCTWYSYVLQQLLGYDALICTKTHLQALESGSEHLMTIGLSSTNKKKNRYMNMAVCEY